MTLESVKKKQLVKVLFTTPKVARQISQTKSDWKANCLFLLLSSVITLSTNRECYDT